MTKLANMKTKIVLCAIMLLVPHLVFSIETISIKKFGAKGDGKTNDHIAFQQAAEYINRAGHDVTLVIPFGIYIVGNQVPGQEWLLNGDDLIFLKDCRSIEIVGEPKNGKYPKLRYKDGLYFGSFEGNPLKGKLKPKCVPDKDYYNRKTCAFIGNCFTLLNCSKVKISSIEIDGNQNGMVLGGNYGDRGKQLNHRGFYLANSANISLSNIYVHHMGLDGVEVTGCEKTTIKNLISTYNGRQGLSWTAGNGLEISDSKFNYSGNSRICSSPGAGMDIEPESKANITHGVFNNCEFMYNAGCGLVNDRNSYLAVDMVFKGCTFLGHDSWAIWARGTRFRFENCKIYGHCTNLVLSADVKSPEDITLFEKCVFSNVYKGALTKPLSPFLLDFNSIKVRMNNCSISSYGIGFLWHSNNDGRPGLESSISNTTIMTNNVSNSHASVNGMQFENCTVLYTEKVSINLGVAVNKNSKVQSLSREIMNQKMKAGFLRPHINTIKPYICTEK